MCVHTHSYVFTDTYCSYTCICRHVYVHTQMHVHIHTHTFMFRYMQHAYTCMFTYMHTYSYMHVHIHAHAHTCMFTYLHTHSYMHVHMHVHMHAYKHMCVCLSKHYSVPHKYVQSLHVNLKLESILKRKRDSAYSGQLIS